MKVIGLTGGIGMGKSTAASVLARFDVPVLDTDLVARQVVEPGHPAVDEIRACFGSEMIGEDGRIRRAQLAERVFQNADARQRLEAILHPRIRQVWLAQVDAWKQEGRGIGAVVIPLLFETDAAPEFTATICIACSSATQWQRLRLRNWTDAEIQQRIEAQWPVEKKMRLSDYVVWSEGNLGILAAQLERILKTESGWS